MILTEEILNTNQAPPTYASATRRATSHIASDTSGPHKSRLPASIWFTILDHLTRVDHVGSLTAEDAFDPDSSPEAGRFFLHADLRFVNRDLYLVSMAHLRTFYLPQYLSHVKAGHSSDPWSGLTSDNRETRVLDLFVAAQVRNDVEKVQSGLFEEHDVKELFDVWQPRARLEDIIMSHGISTGILHSSDSTLDSTATPATTEIRASDITLSLTLKSITLLLPFQSPNNANSSIRKAILTLDRNRGASLESVAEETLRQLEGSNLKRCRSADGKKTWYEVGPVTDTVDDAVPAYSEVARPATEESDQTAKSSRRGKFASWIKKL